MITPDGCFFQAFGAGSFLWGSSMEFLPRRVGRYRGQLEKRSRKSIRSTGREGKRRFTARYLGKR
jgi:hypothetical protein